MAQKILYCLFYYAAYIYKKIHLHSNYNNTTPFYKLRHFALRFNAYFAMHKTLVFICESYVDKNNAFYIKQRVFIS